MSSSTQSDLRVGLREIREEYPDADEREHKLRVAIRGSFGATQDEEAAAYERISKALS